MWLALEFNEFIFKRNKLKEVVYDFDFVKQVVVLDENRESTR